MQRLALSLLLVAVSPLARASTPLVMTHSGFLLDSAERGVDAQQLPFGFSVWTDATASGAESKLWPADGDATCTTDVHNGYYGVVLDGTKSTGCGAGLTADLFSLGAPRFLQVSVDGVAMLPRLRVASVPTATIATRALEADTFGGHEPAWYAAAAHTHPAAEITDFDAKASAAAVAAGVPWESVTGRPETFPASTHGHVLADVTDVTATKEWPGTTPWDRVLGKPTTFAPASHTHALAELADVTATTEWPGTAQWSRVLGKPTTFAPSSHTHLFAELSDVTATTEWPGTAQWNRVLGKPTTFAPSSHTHAASEVTGIPASLAGATVPGTFTTTGNLGVGAASVSEKLEVSGRILGTPIAGRWYVSSAVVASTATWAESFNNATEYFLRTSDNKGIQIKRAGTYLVSGTFYWANASKGDEVEGYFKVGANTVAFMSPTASTDDGVCSGSFTDIINASVNDVLSITTNAGQGDIQPGANQSFLVITRLN